MAESSYYNYCAEEEEPAIEDSIVRQPESAPPTPLVVELVNQIKGLREHVAKLEAEVQRRRHEETQLEILNHLVDKMSGLLRDNVYLTRELY